MGYDRYAEQAASGNDWMFWGLIAIGVLIGVSFIVFTLIKTFFVVEQQTALIIERFGKFLRIANPGLNIKIPFVDQIAGDESLRVQELQVIVDTKTLDNVFVKVIVAVQYQVLRAKIYEAFYMLEDAEGQITSYVFDVVRARVPKILLDTLFETKEEIAIAVKDELSEVMDDYGYGIVKALVTDIDPDAKVKAAMNDINAATRERAAATERGEAEKTLRVKAAEAEATSKKLQGQGIADQRKAIIDGLQASVTAFSGAVKGATPADVMHMVLLTQYLDTLKEIGMHAQTNTILLPHSPGALGDLWDQIRNVGITTGIAASQASGNGMDTEAESATSHLS